MTDASALTAKEIGGKAVVFKELTVAEIRSMTVSSREHNLLNDGLFEELSLAEIPPFTNLEMADLEDMVPSDIQKVIDGCRERNPHFFKMLARLAQGRTA